MRPGTTWKLAGIVLLAVACGIVIYKLPMNLGLDLRGGTRLVLEAKDTEAVKADEDMTGNDLKNAVAGTDEYGRAAVHFELTPEGSQKFERATRENIGRKIAIYLDQELLSDPVVQSVIKDKGQIVGIGSMDRAKDLSMMLRAGALPIPLEIVHSEVLEPTLGQESIDQSKLAAIIGAGLVVLFMLTVYKLPGAMADLALVVYGLIVLAALAGLHAVLTLPGIAGLILSVGMAVDANVIIFERIKEEMRGGKRLRAAIDAGFERALACILDSNVTTLIAAAVLYVYGTGAVRGFAVTLSLGVLASMFTAITATRVFLNAVIDRAPDRYARYFGA